MFHGLARQKESLIEVGHLMPGHVHMMISIPTKYAVSQIDNALALGGDYRVT